MTAWTKPSLHQLIQDLAPVDEIRALIDGTDDLNTTLPLMGLGGVTPLMMALRYNNTIAIELIEKGADIKARNDNGDSPLHLAASYGQTVAATLLLRAGADINDRCSKFSCKCISDKTSVHKTQGCSR